MKLFFLVINFSNCQTKWIKCSWEGEFYFLHNFFFFLCVKLFFLEKTQMYLINRLKNVFAGDFLKTLRKKIIFCVKRIEKKKHFRKKKYMWNWLENLFADHYLMCENFSRKRNLNCIILCQTKWKIYLFFKFIWESELNIFFAGEFYSFWVNFLFIFFSLYVKPSERTFQEKN